MAHEDKVQAAIEALDEVFSDQSVSQSETASSLRDLRDHIDILISSLSDE